jgi:hypothetical protein
MHNEPGYPMKGWLIPPQISTYSEAQALIKPDIETEVEAYNASTVDVLPKPATEKLKKTESVVARKTSYKGPKRPKSESEVDRYFARLSTAQPILQNDV